MPLLVLLAILEFLQDFHNKFILLLQMQKNNLILFLRSNVHRKIRFGSSFSVPALKSLTNHDQRH